MKKKRTAAVKVSSTVEEMVDALFTTIIDELGFTFISINITDESAVTLYNLRAIGIAAKQQGVARPLEELAETVRGEVFTSQCTRIVQGMVDPTERQWYSTEPETELSRVFIPVLSHTTSLGILEAGFIKGERDEVSGKDRRLLEALVRQTAIAVENMRLIQQLHHERHLLHTLMDNIPDAIYFKDTASRFIRSSRALAQKIGLADPDRLIGKTDFDLFTNEHAQQAFDDEQKILQTGTPEIDIIEKETWADNRITWVSTTKMPLRDDDGTIIGTFGVSRDITGRKEMEDALKFRLEFEEHITSLSSKFINLDVKYFDGGVRGALNLIGTFTAADRSFVILLNEPGGRVEQRYDWQSGNGEPEIRRPTDFNRMPWLDNLLKSGREIILRSPDDLPGAAAADRKTLQETGIGSLVYVPLILTGAVGGIIGIESAASGAKWSEDTLALIKITGEVIMNAFSRKRSEEKLQHANNVLELRVSERTEDLRKANELLTEHIGQLNFLNSSVYRLSPIITTDTLLPEILSVFMERFPDAQGAVCFFNEDSYECMYPTHALDNDPNREALRETAARIADPGLSQPLLIADRTSDRRLGATLWNGIDRLTCLIAVPLVVDGSCKALLLILAAGAYANVYSREQSLLTTLAAHAAICLSNALNYQERAEKARLDGELDAARSIQHRFTPQHRPAIPRIDLKGFYLPAYKVGGDYLDYFKTGRGDWVVVIADVCGKGIPAALLMTTLRSAFRIQAETETSACALLCAVNRFMTLNIDERSFVTALCLMIGRDGSAMTYARAGHHLLVKLDVQGGAPHNVGCSGIALGLTRDMEQFAANMEEKTIPLVSGDSYMIYTDGLIEATNPQKQPYGFARLNTLLPQQRTCSSEEMVAAVIDDFRSFTGDAPDYDDLAFCIFKVL